MNFKVKGLFNALEDFFSNLNMSDDAKKLLSAHLQRLKKQKVNILITGATGCGKSSTINALFGENIAKVGQGSTPETMDIKSFPLTEYFTLWDSPGLGDGKEADKHHAQNITDKLYELDENNEPLIDLVLVILDGSSRDLGTSFQLINEVIIPVLKQNNQTDRLLVAINQCDMAMKGRYWDDENNKPEPQLIEFLEEKVESTRQRIKEATGVDTQPIYYSAGYKDSDQAQKPYNLLKLLSFMLEAVPMKKRPNLAEHTNQDSEVWKADEDVVKHRQKVEQSIWESIISVAKEGGRIGEEIGSFLLGSSGKTVGRIIGSLVGGVVGSVGSLLGIFF